MEEKQIQMEKADEVQQKGAHFNLKGAEEITAKRLSGAIVLCD